MGYGYWPDRHQKLNKRSLHSTLNKQPNKSTAEVSGAWFSSGIGTFAAFLLLVLLLLLILTLLLPPLVLLLLAFPILLGIAALTFGAFLVSSCGRSWPIPRTLPLIIGPLVVEVHPPRAL